jgi:hypothetical protein
MPEETDRGSAEDRPTPPGEPEKTDPRSAEDRPTPPREPPGRNGSLSVERHRKADGRLLILYRWVGADG